MRTRWLWQSCSVAAPLISWHYLVCLPTPMLTKDSIHHRCYHATGPPCSARKVSLFFRTASYSAFNDWRPLNWTAPLVMPAMLPTRAA
ncbi:hypothetical protein B0T14DRAFT_524069 [Immersiella caudata]|uniref:Secreted protein n=1 Tax=Immersiella caudata TaxID=314043 RepID=A0AA40BX92_9PEZI|nr:hypothetical protein B0T14DRAFT_524069 [Immersiella caudata]